MRYGHFDNEKKEYVIDNVALPASWTNYLGVKDTCVVINHTAGGCVQCSIRPPEAMPSTNRRNITGLQDLGEMQFQWTDRGIMYI